ncbi:MAG TPA: ankyrin repeat domain-containing protein [Chloroflexota bacterium]|jgi:ankyrin repeat protein
MFDAIRGGDIDRVQQLLDDQPELARTPNADGVTPVLWALYTNHPDIAEALLGRIAEDVLSIFEAAATGRAARVADILDGDPQAIGAYAPDGFQPLGLASFFGQAEALEVLIARGADVNSPARNGLAVAPLHSALAGPKPDLARQLLAAGADPNARQSGHVSPLHETAHIGLLELTKLLLEHGADPTMADDQGRTPEAVARERGHTAVADLLANASRSR